MLVKVTLAVLKRARNRKQKDVQKYKEKDTDMFSWVESK
jgi:hypothetical protein